jgi:hypothetical protein
MQNTTLRWLISAVAVAAVLGVAFHATYVDGFKPFMNGQLSSKHSALEHGCANCHEPWKGVSDKACVTCHGDKKHALKTKAGHEGANVTGCSSCHREHKGRFWNTRHVEGEKCSSCHKFGKHPDIKRAAIGNHPYFSIKCLNCHKDSKHPAAMDLSTNFDGMGRTGFSHKLHLQRKDIEPTECFNCHEKPAGSAGSFKIASLEDGCGACHKMYDVADKAKPASATENCPTCHISGQAKSIESLKTRKPMPTFSHSRHSKQKCMDCHDTVGKDDVMANFMPVISKCMDCHEKQMVSNDCSTCHSFHSLGA